MSFTLQAERSTATALCQFAESSTLRPAATSCAPQTAPPQTRPNLQRIPRIDGRQRTGAGMEPRKLRVLALHSFRTSAKIFQEQVD